MIIWAGTSSDDVGMIVEHYPSVQFPEKNIEVQNVPGRNGDIVLFNGSYSNYEQSYSVFLDSKNIGGLESVIPKIANWLLGNDSYQRLEDSYFPAFYRMAYYTGGTEFISILNEYGQGTLTFNCAPERYYKYGETPIQCELHQYLTNPSSFPAKPFIFINGTGSDGTLFFDEKPFQIKAVPAYLAIDAKLHTAYTGNGSYNYNIVGDYEDLTLGPETRISWYGGISSVQITPRWWTI